MLTAARIRTERPHNDRGAQLAACLHVPAVQPTQSAAREALQRRASARHAVSCSALLGGLVDQVLVATHANALIWRFVFSSMIEPIKFKICGAHKGNADAWRAGAKRRPQLLPNTPRTRSEKGIHDSAGARRLREDAATLQLSLSLRHVACRVSRGAC